METIPTKFQFYTFIQKFKLIWPQMTLAWPEIDNVKIPSKIYFEIPTKFQVHTEIVLIWPQMTPGLPQMIPEIISKICLEMVTMPTKFQVHTKPYTNMTSDDQGVTGVGCHGARPKPNFFPVSVEELEWRGYPSPLKNSSDLTHL